MYTVYSKDNCPQCRIAIQMLRAKDAPIQVMKMGVDYTRDELLTLVPGAKTLPQVFHGDKHIGAVAELRDHLNGLTEPGPA